ncbi:N-acetyltransferase [Bacillus timonensis]|nr:N-acetyltransferase [Bacillus timonensis]
MIEVRAELELDVLMIKNVNDEAFGQENEGRLVEGIRQSENFIPELSLVAETVEGEIVGHILFSFISIEQEDGTSVKTLALAPMAVKPARQNQGIGSMLVRKGLARGRDLGYKSVVVLGHPNFYPKFGFVPASTKGISPPFKLPDEVFMALELVDGGLDGMSGKVVYPPAFSNV